MNGLGDFSIAKLIPIAFGNSRDRRLHRRVLIRVIANALPVSSHSRGY
jgi:hypothetical protein